MSPRQELFDPYVVQVQSVYHFCHFFTYDKKQKNITKNKETCQQQSPCVLNQSHRRLAKSRTSEYVIQIYNPL